MRFATPEAFYLLLIIIPIIVIYILRERGSRGAILFSDTSFIDKLPSQPMVKVRHFIFGIRILGFVSLVIALARPQDGKTTEIITSQGIDISLVLDLSTSMKALDFKPNNRLEEAKEQIHKFIDMRKNDKIGLTLFAGRSYTKCPLTLDYELLSGFIDDIDFGQISEEQSTAIGTAIATAANRLKDSKAKSRIMILLTDGSNNSGEISPSMAATACAELGIKVYTIGMGKKGRVPYPVNYTNPFTGKTEQRTRMMESDLDEPTLQNIATVTGGIFFRAENSSELQNIYESIDRLEKTKIKSKMHTRWKELFYIFLAIGFSLILLDFILMNSRFRRIP